MTSELEKLQKKINTFCEDRDWDQFHSPKNLVMALMGEVGELTEIFQWLDCEESRKVMDDPKKANSTKEEVADVFIYLMRIASKLDIDLIKVAEEKLKLNEEKYPVSKSKGRSNKYTEL